MRTTELFRSPFCINKNNTAKRILIITLDYFKKTEYNIYKVATMQICLRWKYESNKKTIF